MMLHIQMKKEVMRMSERFPGIDWYCDRCNAYLNDQPGFDDHHYVWKCTECGHKNSISSDDINGGGRKDDKRRIERTD